MDCPQVFNNTKQSLINVLSQFEADKPEFKGDGGPAVPASFIADLTKIGKSLSHEVNKLALAFRGEPKATSNDALSMCARLEMAAISLLAQFLSLPSNCGRYFLQEVQKSCVEIIRSCIGVMDELVQCYDKPPSDPLLQAVGGVWNKCDYIERMPTSNRDACLRKLKSERAMIEDAISELEEAKTAFTDAEETDEDLWTESEFKLVNSSSGVLKVAQALMKKSLTAMKQCESEAGLDEATDILRTVSAVVDDFALSVYAPIDVDELKRTAECLTVKLREVLEHLEVAPFMKREDAEGWVTFLNKAVVHNDSKLKTELAAQGMAALNVDG